MHCHALNNVILNFKANLTCYEKKNERRLKIYLVWICKNAILLKHALKSKSNTLLTLHSPSKRQILNLVKYNFIGLDTFWAKMSNSNQFFWIY